MSRFRGLRPSWRPDAAVSSVSGQPDPDAGWWRRSGTPPPRPGPPPAEAARTPESRERLRRIPRPGPGLLRRPRGRQHEVLLGEAQGDLRRERQGADDRALRRARAGVRRREGVPALPRRPVREGQDAVQDPPGRVRRGRPGDRLVRRALGARPARGRRVLRGAGPRLAAIREAMAHDRPAPQLERLVAELRPRRAGRSAASSSRPRRAGTPPTTRGSTCSGASSCSSAGPTGSTASTTRRSSTGCATTGVRCDPSSSGSPRTLASESSLPWDSVGRVRRAGLAPVGKEGVDDRDRASEPGRRDRCRPARASQGGCRREHHRRPGRHRRRDRHGGALPRLVGVGEHDEDLQAGLVEVANPRRAPRGGCASGRWGRPRAQATATPAPRISAPGRYPARQHLRAGRVARLSSRRRCSPRQASHSRVLTGLTPCGRSPSPARAPSRPSSRRPGRRRGPCRP